MILTIHVNFVGRIVYQTHTDSIFAPFHVQFFDLNITSSTGSVDQEYHILSRVEDEILYFSLPV